MKPPRILVIGSANVDLVATVPRIPKPGETIIGDSFKTVCGGKGANQAVAAARQGAATHFAGCVGGDAFGVLQRETLTRDGIDLSYVRTHPTEPTGTALILVAADGQNSIVVVPAANGGIRPEDIEAMVPLFAHVDVILLQLEIPLDTVEAALALAQRADVLSILDAGPAQRIPESILSLASIVSPNETEAEVMTGLTIRSVDDAYAAADKLMQMGAREVVLKLGDKGCLYVGKQNLHVPAFPIVPVDTTAAGDAFTAGLACVWRSLPLREALRFANATGALAAMGAGAQTSIPTRVAVEAFLQQHPE